MSEAKPIHGVPVELLKKWHRDLDACQKVIWLSGCRPQVPGGFDPDYVTDAQHSLKQIEATIAKVATPPVPAAWEYRDTNMGNELTYNCLNHYYRPKYGGDEHDYVQGSPLYREPVVRVMPEGQVGVVLSPEEMGAGFDRKFGDVLWFAGHRKPGPLYQRSFDAAELLGMVELLAGVCEKAQQLLDSTNTLHAEHSENLLVNALDACGHDNGGWKSVVERIKRLLK